MRKRAKSNSIVQEEFEGGRMVGIVAKTTPRKKNVLILCRANLSFFVDENISVLRATAVLPLGNVAVRHSYFSPDPRPSRLCQRIKDRALFSVSLSA